MKDALGREQLIKDELGRVRPLKDALGRMHLEGCTWKGALGRVQLMKDAPELKLDWFHLTCALNWFLFSNLSTLKASNFHLFSRSTTYKMSHLFLKATNIRSTSTGSK